MGKYLRGEQQPGFDLILRIAERSGTNVSLDWLLLGDGGDEPRQRNGWTRAEFEDALESRIRQAYDNEAKERAFQIGAAGQRIGSGWSWRIDVSAFLNDALVNAIRVTREWCHWAGGAGIISERIEQARSALGALSSISATTDTGLLAESTATVSTTLDALSREIQQLASPAYPAVVPAAAPVKVIALAYPPGLQDAARIVYEGEIAVNDGRWQPLYSDWPHTKFEVDVRKYPSGTKLAHRIRARDVTDNLASEWSEVRTFYVQHAEDTTKSE